MPPAAICLVAGLFVEWLPGWQGREFHVVAVAKGAAIEHTRWAARDLQSKTGQTGVPVIEIRSRWIVGFDKPAIKREPARA